MYFTPSRRLALESIKGIDYSRRPEQDCEVISCTESCFGFSEKAWRGVRGNAIGEVCSLRSMIKIKMPLLLLFSGKRRQTVSDCDCCHTS